MSQNNPIHTYILHAGVDVAKLSLQLHLAGSFHSLANDARGHTRLLKLLRAHPGVHVVCEATGGYEQAFVRVLHAAGIPVSITEAGRVRYFARAQGQRAKTDPIDAAVLSAYGDTFQPPPTMPASLVQQRLAALAQRLRQLVQLHTNERNHAEHYTDPLCLRQSRQLCRNLQTQIAQCEAAIARLIAGDPQLACKAARIKAIPGIGPVVAATLLAEMPELGTLNRRTVAALCGLAPYNRDSGAQKGIRRIHGGRPMARSALYMAALTAVRYDRILKAFYLRLLAAGKKPLVAMTACMRKLIILINQLLKNNQFQLAN